MTTTNTPHFGDYQAALAAINAVNHSDGHQIWQLLPRLRNLRQRFPDDVMIRDAFERVLDLVCMMAADICAAADMPEGRNPGKKLGAMLAATKTQGVGRNRRRAAQARRRGEVAAMRAWHGTIAGEILHGKSEGMSRSELLSIACTAAGVSERTARGYDLPPAIPAAPNAPDPQPALRRMAKPKRRTVTKPKSWR